jgi:hypothetical protein
MENQKPEQDSTGAALQLIVGLIGVGLGLYLLFG